MSEDRDMVKHTTSEVAELLSTVRLDLDADGSLAWEFEIRDTPISDTLSRVRPFPNNAFRKNSGQTIAGSTEIGRTGYEIDVRRAGEPAKVIARFDADLDAAEILVHLASRLQDLAAEVDSRPRPPCPMHAHPLEATIRGGRAQWVCPAAGSHWSRPMGDL